MNSTVNHIDYCTYIDRHSYLVNIAICFVFKMKLFVLNTSKILLTVINYSLFLIVLTFLH